MFIPNIRKESGVSTGILTTWAEGNGSLTEIICSLGLPNDVTFQQMIDVLGCVSLDPSFKTYVLSKAQATAKTDDDYEALKPYIIKSEEKQGNTQTQPSSKNSQAQKKSTSVFIPETLDEIQALKDCLTSDISKKDEKEVIKKLDTIVCVLIEEAGNDGDKLLEIYKLFPPDSKKFRVPYLKQRLLKLGKKHLI